MKRALLALALIEGSICANEPAAFTPPKAYPMSRYVTGWKTNPFMLKTTPAAVKSASFAEHLVIGSVYGNLSDPTVVVVNIKTHERIRLRAGLPAGNRIKLNRLQLGSGKRTDMLAVVSLGAESAEIRYGTSYLTQMAAAEKARSTVSVLQQRQQSLNQHSGSQALPRSNAQQPAATLVASSAISIHDNHQSPQFTAGQVNSPFEVSFGKSQTDSSDSHNHASDSRPSAPPMVEDLLGAAQIPLRRYNFRAGDESVIPHLDPQ